MWKKPALTTFCLFSNKRFIVKELNQSLQYNIFFPEIPEGCQVASQLPIVSSCILFFSQVELEKYFFLRNDLQSKNFF